MQALGQRILQIVSVISKKTSYTAYLGDRDICFCDRLVAIQLYGNQRYNSQCKFHKGDEKGCGILYG